MPRQDTSIDRGYLEGTRLDGTAFPWFDRDTYPRILEVMTDHDLMPATYDRWLRQAQRVLEKARRDGQRPIRAHIDPDDFLAWCVDHDWPADSKARLGYAAHMAQLHLLPKNMGDPRAPAENPG